MIKNLRDLIYLQNLLQYEKEQMEKANVSKDFFEYKSLTLWLKELDQRITELENEIK